MDRQKPLTEVINFRMTRDEKLALDYLAKQHAGGNTSALFRRALAALLNQNRDDLAPVFSRNGLTLTAFDPLCGTVAQ